MRHLCALPVLSVVLSCNSFSPAVLLPLDINARWEVNSELGTVRAFCITIENDRIVRVGDCDDSPGTTEFSTNPAATISETDEIVIYYSSTASPQTLVFFDMHRQPDNVLRGVMILYTNGSASTNTTITNTFWTPR